jgi:hypothetical protein
MRRIAGGLIVSSLLVLGAAVGLSGQSAPTNNLIVGTWKFNPQKSKMTNSLPPRSLIRKYEDRGGGVYIVMQELIDAAGWKTVSLYVAKEDGADYPLVVSGADEIPTGWISLKRIDAYTAEQVEKTGGGFGGGNAGGADGPRVRSRGTRKLSPDAKTLTLTVVAAGGGGGDDAAAGIAAAAGARGGTIQRDADVLVFDKQ